MDAGHLKLDLVLDASLASSSVGSFAERRLAREKALLLAFSHTRQIAGCELETLFPDLLQQTGKKLVLWARSGPGLEDLSAIRVRDRLIPLAQQLSPLLAVTACKRFHQYFTATVLALDTRPGQLRDCEDVTGSCADAVLSDGAAHCDPKLFREIVDAQRRAKGHRADHACYPAGAQIRVAAFKGCLFPADGARGIELFQSGRKLAHAASHSSTRQYTYDILGGVRRGRRRIFGATLGLARDRRRVSEHYRESSKRTR